MNCKIAISTSGHDLSEVYVMFQCSQEDVLLANGKNRTIAKPKRKNPKHVTIVSCKDSKLEEMLMKCCNDEMIRQTVLYYKKKLL